MATEMITLKLDEKFLGVIDSVVKRQGYQNRTEFIRNALREKVEEANLKDAMIANLRGAAKKKTSNEEYEKIREKAFEDIDKKLR